MLENVFFSFFRDHPKIQIVRKENVLSAKMFPRPPYKKNNNNNFFNENA